MGWEKRGNGRYYYHKRRVGGRVVSEYLGNGSLAQLVALLDQKSQLEKEHERQQRQIEREAMTMDVEIRREVDRIVDTTRAMTTAILLITGHHTHRREWRKKRVTT